MGSYGTVESARSYTDRHSVNLVKAPVVLEVHICDQRRSYLAEFATEGQALAFMERKTDMNHAFYEVAVKPLPESCETLINLLYPTCDHGMSAWLCTGHMHF